MEHVIPASAGVRQEHAPHQKGGERAWFGVFAVLLGLLSTRHELYVDETQAWLIARDSKSFFEMLGHLRYEGHPALWYSILYIPAHLSWSPVCMQVINFGLALVMAWLVLSERRLNLSVRVLSIFSVSIFFHMGLMARSYMLAGLLLMGAVRLLTAERPRHWLAMLLLALAMNTHFFAIPVVCAIFVWIYWFGPSLSLGAIREKLCTKRFWGSVGMLLIALAACYFTVRPAHDLYTPHYDRADISRFGYLVLGIGRVWDYFVPFSLGALNPEMREVLGPWHHPSFLAASITLCLWFLAISVLHSKRSRLFLVTVSVLWMAEVFISVHIPGPFHSSFLFLAFVVAVLLDTIDGEKRPLLPQRLGYTGLLALLWMQIPITAHYWMQDFFLAFSGAQPTANWLEKSGLENRPLIIVSDTAAPTILAFDHIQSAYYPTCHCRGSFVVFRKGRDEKTQVSVAEINAIREQFGVSPVVLSYYELPPATLKETGLKLAYTSPQGAFWQYENLHAYADGNLNIASNGVHQ